MGYLRFWLAVNVLLYHAWHSVFYTTGYLSVFCFFAISGYLITHICNQVYGPDANGYWRFFVNRSLRIYPNYLACLLISWGLFMLAAPGDELPQNLPVSTTDWLRNIFIVGLDNYEPRVIGAAWSLSVELIYYVIMVLVLARHRIVAHLFLIVTGLKLFTGFDIPWFSSQFNLLLEYGFYFSLGIVGYFHADWLVEHIKKYWLLTVSFAVFWHYFIPHIAWPPFYYEIGVIVCMPLILVCTQYRGREGSFDDVIGKLSYPLFLIHSAVIFVLMNKGFSAPVKTENIADNIWFIAAALAGSVAISLLLYWGIERPIENIRKSVRPRRVYV